MQRTPAGNGGISTAKLKQDIALDYVRYVPKRSLRLTLQLFLERIPRHRLTPQL